MLHPKNLTSTARRCGGVIEFLSRLQLNDLDESAQDVTVLVEKRKVATSKNKQHSDRLPVASSKILLGADIIGDGTEVAAAHQCPFFTPMS